ncbi:DUF5919 domain-containing protein [Solwaraspora sp. WMMD1047]|uniref:DUF5919 domain-containing protein n=1 Tax=Solwaraspora sp. WMMD1047 TaxID=3016102 RepID=UPI00241733D5|nr:DUF5919 domain-containing protein [Solwaraspora sp. WMMD1047]MDG4830117.1 DUF5919 domain-containing protein [Solwaraspora sp. WMMD1047]
MTTVQRWTGRETRALRQAQRMSVRDFAKHLGVGERTVSKWEAGHSGICPRPEMQAALDTALAQGSDDVQDRFRSALGHPAAASRDSPEGPSDPLSIGYGTAPQDHLPHEHLADLTAVYTNRAELSTHIPVGKLLDGARDVRAVGLSLNVLCQDYADRRWHALVEGGARIRCLFLDPAGSALRAREAEEGFPAGHLAALTKLNIETLTRVRGRLPDEVQGNIDIATYDETIRFNIVLVDGLCVAQPYLPESRGVDSPAFVIKRRPDAPGLFPVFEQVFESQWERGRRL